MIPEVRAYRDQFLHLLADPEMAALLQAHPTLARTLRRTLGIKALPDPRPCLVATLLFAPPEPCKPAPPPHT